MGEKITEEREFQSISEIPEEEIDATNDEEKLADIVENEIEKEIRKSKTRKCKTIENFYYYILRDGKIYPASDYDIEVEKGKRSANDIYAFVETDVTRDFDEFLFDIDYGLPSISDILKFYLEKAGFRIANEVPTPNLKYYIHAVVEFGEDRPQYLAVNIYDIDSLARALRIPQIVEQKLGNKPRTITADEFNDIERIVAEEQPILAGYTYDEALRIPYHYYVDHNNSFKDDALKIAHAYLQLFPTPYQVCYEWKARWFNKIDCLKLERLKPSSHHHHHH
uniref:STRUCTURAL PROTEIN ORF273 n=1 Tax=Acidianus two-tailed virus TaxID=315953 RepID=UPI000290CF37|nr:Chain A, Structural Protein Orf273 [Acidianus two-tailed virus]4ART_B Chain B, Structural Protein Orf273 [Acidianus two-tailed virus]